MDTFGGCGLQNLGNTCFINSCVQILCNIKELITCLQKKHSFQQNKPETIFMLQFLTLCRHLQFPKNDGKVLNPREFIATVQTVAKYQHKSEFAKIRQSDFAEFLLFVIECFHKVKTRKIRMEIVGTVESATDKLAFLCYQLTKESYEKDYSEIWNLFFAIQVMEMYEINNNNQQQQEQKQEEKHETKKREISSLSSSSSSSPLLQKPEFFFMIDLPVISNNLVDCFRAFVQGETLSGENAWYCEEQQRSINVQKRTVFWSLPTVLVICLKRFQASGKKISTHVHFPLQDLNLSSFIVGYKKKTFIYDLFAVCNHIGKSLYGGHYNTCIKKENENAWFEYDDEVIQKLSSETEIITPNAYVLFYRKQGNSL